MKKRFTEEQIIRVLDEGRLGEKVEEICRRHGISPSTYYNWRLILCTMLLLAADAVAS